MDVIQTAPVSLIRDFYHAYYRPERATLIVVGDIDPRAIEAKIEARFSDGRRRPAGGDPVLGPPLKRGTETRLVVDPNMARSTMIGWVSAYETPPATAAVVRDNFIQSLGLTIVNRRLQALANSPQRPFQDALLTSAEYAALSQGHLSRHQQ